MGLVARSVPAMGLIDAMTEALTHHLDPQLTPNMSNISNSTSDMVSVAVDGRGEIVRVTPPTSTHTHPCLALGEYKSGSVHSYEYSVYGRGNWSECKSIVRSLFLPRMAAALDVPCLQVSLVPLVVCDLITTLV